MSRTCIVFSSSLRPSPRHLPHDSIPSKKPLSLPIHEERLLLSQHSIMRASPQRPQGSHQPQAGQAASQRGSHVAPGTLVQGSAASCPSVGSTHRRREQMSGRCSALFAPANNNRAERRRCRGRKGGSTGPTAGDTAMERHCLPFLWGRRWGGEWGSVCDLAAVN